VKLIKGANILWHRGVAVPGFRNQHRKHMGKAAAVSVKSSIALSNIAESLPPGVITGITLWMSSPSSDEAKTDWRACSQFTLPRSVLISPLWQM